MFSYVLYNIGTAETAKRRVIQPQKPTKIVQCYQPEVLPRFALWTEHGRQLSRSHLPSEPEKHFSLTLFSYPSDHAGAPPQRLRHRPWPHLLRQGQDGLHDGLLCGHGFRGALWGILCSQVRSEGPGAAANSRKDHASGRRDLWSLHGNRYRHPVLAVPTSSRLYPNSNTNVWKWLCFGESGECSVK